MERERTGKGGGEGVLMGREGSGTGREWGKELGGEGGNRRIKQK